ncbi:hypothetical protein [Pontibacter liquoris]|uniref:hypothetical protein n=1 Tax=Pontibacter liquoris TaxID=2905677 RepID=UPI001FA7535D|nr:hypothetical protein [Pontibacter liquoris]
MSARSFELLIEFAYAPEAPQALEGGTAAAYEHLERALKASRLKGGQPSEELSFYFEMVRLGVALAFVKAFTRLSDNEKSIEALETLQEALKANSTKDIDKIIQKKIGSFDHLYHEIFVNEHRELLLGLFERTLDAGTKEELDELTMEGLELLEDIDWEAAAQNDEDDEPLPPLDEDFLKNL